MRLIASWILAIAVLFVGLYPVDTRKQPQADTGKQDQDNHGANTAAAQPSEDAAEGVLELL